MTSKKKRKPKYGDIWEQAVKWGMNYVGYITEQQRDKVFGYSKLMVDASYSKTYSRFGSHFNRVMVDSLIGGCVPVVRDWAMTKNGVFTVDEHYLEIPVTNESDPGKIDAIEFAEWLDYYLKHNNAYMNEVVTSGQDLIRKKFDATKVARRLLA